MDRKINGNELLKPGSGGCFTGFHRDNRGILRDLLPQQFVITIGIEHIWVRILIQCDYNRVNPGLRKIFHKCQWPVNAAPAQGRKFKSNEKDIDQSGDGFAKIGLNYIFPF